MNVKFLNSDISYLLTSFIVVMFLSYVTFQPAQADSEDKVLSMQNFSNITCTAGMAHVMLIGNFTNGDTPLKVIFLKMFLLDGGSHIISAGSGYISDVKPHETKIFNAITRFNGNFSSCTIQIDSIIAK